MRKIEEKAWKLYPEKLKADPYDLTDINKEARKAYLQCYNDLMNVAVEGEVVQDIQGINRVKSFGKIPETLRFGDKVKIIIVKQDE